MAASQVRIVLSEPVTMCVPSGLNEVAQIGNSCPRRTVSCSPVAVSQMRAVLSGEAVTIRVPSGLKAIE